MTSPTAFVGTDIAKADVVVACRLDAHLLALFAQRVRPTPRPLPDAVLQQLDALMTRRRQLLDMLTAEGHRLERAAAPIRREITRQTEVVRGLGYRGRTRRLCGLQAIACREDRVPE